MSEYALKGVRVLDLTQAYSGPFCTYNLADHGAEVIKIELPGSGDQTRGWGPMRNGHSGYYAYVNRNKKGITLNLKTDEGKEVFTRLLKTADVVCENYKVGVMERLGFSYEHMKEINPRIIYASISGFGVNGPLAKRPAYDIVAQAMSGLMSITGFPDSPPTKVGPSIGDNFSGAYLCIGILMALYKREKTGEGSRIDVAMYDTLFASLENLVIDYTVTGVIPQRAGNADPSITPFDSFRAKDGDFVLGCGTDAMFIKLAHVMGRDDLPKDPRFCNNYNRSCNYLPDLKNAIEEWTLTKTVAEIEDTLIEIGIPVARIQNIKEACENPQMKARNMLWSVYQPEMESEFLMPGTPIKIHGERDGLIKPAPRLGEDNNEILTGIGYSEAEIESLKEKGAI